MISLEDARLVENSLAYLKRSGWVVELGSDQVILKPDPKSKRFTRYGFNVDAKFYFTSLDAAGGWVRGFSDCETYAAIAEHEKSVPRRGRKS